MVHCTLRNACNVIWFTWKFAKFYETSKFWRNTKWFLLLKLFSCWSGFHYKDHISQHALEHTHGTFYRGARKLQKIAIAVYVWNGKLTKLESWKKKKKNMNLRSGKPNFTFLERNNCRVYLTFGDIVRLETLYCCQKTWSHFPINSCYSCKWY